MTPKEPDIKGLIIQLDNLMHDLEAVEGEKRTCDILYKMILVRQSKGMIKSQSSEIEDQNGALEECREAERRGQRIRGRGFYHCQRICQPGLRGVVVAVQIESK